jgi:GSH-dependent disulfide-bond oxidoreductase
VIDLYTFKTPNGLRASIALEECGLPYTAHRVELLQGEQNTPAFRAINPAGAIPVIVDADGPGRKTITISQSGAILFYCAEKSGRLIPSDPTARAAVMQWTMLGLTDGSDAAAGIFRLSRISLEPGVALYKNRLQRTLDVIDARLAESEYLAGELSIADLALYPIGANAKEMVGFGARRHLERWFDTLSARASIVRGMAVPT